MCDSMFSFAACACSVTFPEEMEISNSDERTVADFPLVNIHPNRMHLGDEPIFTMSMQVLVRFTLSFYAFVLHIRSTFSCFFNISC